MNAHRIRAVLLGSAIAAGAVAPVAREPRPPAPSMNGEALAGAIAREEDHVTALELAQWIRARKPGLRVIDLRSSAAFTEHHVPRAENIPIERLVRMQFSADETIILLSDAGGHAAQAWVLLRSTGGPQAFFLRGGMREWNEDVLSPALDPAADAESIAEIAALSRYFGGMPQKGTRSVPREEDTIARELRRRGC